MNKQLKNLKVPTLFVLAFALGYVLLGLWSCDYPNLPPKGNSPPHTRLANIPANDTIKQYIAQGKIPEVTLYWAGDDGDGYVVAYTYHWTDFYGGNEYLRPSQTVLNLVALGPVILPKTIMVKGYHSLPNIYNFFATFTTDDQALANVIVDSLETGRPFAVPYKSGVVIGDSIFGGDSVANPTPTRGRFIFESPDTTMHRFSVAAIDNNGAVDPNPAVVNFWTTSPPGPFVQISAPDLVGHVSLALVDSNQIAIRYITDRFPGLQFDYSAVDRATDDLWYSWAVDSIRGEFDWSPWSRSQTAFVTAINFKPIVTGWHQFYVRAKNRWGSLSNIDSARQQNHWGFKATILAIDDPNYVHRLLFINSTLGGNGTLGSPDSNQVKAYFSTALDSLGFHGKYDTWTVQGRTVPTAFPNLIYLGNYSTIILSMERVLPPIGSALYQLDVDRQTLLKRYLQAGGNLVCSGPVGQASIVGASGWYHDVVHAIITGQNPARQFVGFKGRSEFGYPNVRIDSTKLPADSLGSIRNIVTMYSAISFGEAIGWFASDSLRPQGRINPVFENAQVGGRFLAQDPIPPARRTFSVVHFGFPLYFGETSSVIAAMRQALIDVHEISN